CSVLQIFCNCEASRSSVENVGMMRVLVVGAGGGGGYFGGRLAGKGRDVTFLLRPGRAGQIERDGLQIVSQHEDACIRVPIVQSGMMQGSYDVILLATKAYGRVLGGLCGIAATVDSGGGIVQSMVSNHDIAFGELRRIDSERVRHIAALF